MQISPPPFVVFFTAFPHIIVQDKPHLGKILFVGFRRIIGVMLIFLLFFRPSADILKPADVPEPETLLDAFGIEEDAYSVEEQEIMKNQTFSDILSSYQIPAETIYDLSQKARSVFDLRHMRAGKSLRIYTEDSLHAAKVVVYRPDPVRFIIFDLRDSVHVYEGRHPVVVRQKLVSGVITSSPYQTLEENGADPALAIKLSEIFGWQIDFYRIQRDDAFKVIYEEEIVNGEPVGLGKIIGARFTHGGRDYYAYHFDDAKGGFYDEKGQTLRRAFLKAPLEYSRISSRFSLRRFHPVQKRYKAHLGTDYAAPTGTPIRATSDGEVIAASYTSGNGKYVKIRHNKTYTTGYLHMSRIGNGIRPGIRVRQGDVIGYVGSTGLATGPHVCYRFWKNGQQVDPLRQELPDAQPIEADRLEAFESFRNTWRPMLEGPYENPGAVAHSGTSARSSS